MSQEWTNSPIDGPTPIGVIVDDSVWNRILRWPGRMLAKALPSGAMPAWQGVALTMILPGGLLLFIGWWAWRRFFR